MGGGEGYKIPSQEYHAGVMIYRAYLADQK